MHVTACFVARNQATILPRAIAAAKSVADAVVVADAGSTDETVKVVRDVGATVVPVVWADDFAGACNAALDAVATEWVLWLNPDELVMPGGWPDLRGITPGVAALAYRVTVRHEYEEGAPERSVSDHQVRLFRKQPAVRYLGRLHPHFNPPIDQTARAFGLAVANAGGQIRHLAYLSKPTPDKVRWSIRLLEAELRDRPGQLGLEIELGRNYLTVGDQTGHRTLAAAANRVFAGGSPPKDAAAVGPLLEYLLTVAPEQNQSGISRDRVRTAAREWFPHVPPVLWAVAGERFAAGDYATAATDLKRLLEWGRLGQFPPSGGFDPEIVGAAAAMNLALCYIHLNRAADALPLLNSLTSHLRWGKDAGELSQRIITSSGNG
ncbi:MAG TPA: glycosyltransferase [Fimbriiglobus sp.]